MSVENEGKAREYGAKGGLTRAKNMSSAERSEAARKAAEAKWAAQGKLKYPRALHEAPLQIGGIDLWCAVLDDAEHTRVLSRASFVRAIGRKGKVKGGRKYDEESKTPVFLTAQNLKSFLPNDLDSNSAPIIYKPLKGPRQAIGYRADFLPTVCGVFVDAMLAGSLQENQKEIAKRCQILNKGFARVGITALIDEATGYQDVRARDAMARILEQYVAKEWRKWTRTFPLEYTRELCRLRGVPFPTKPPYRLPRYFGHLTNDLVYDRMAPGVLAELRRKNPTVAPGQRRHKHFQWLTENVGDPRLRAHLWRVIGIMQVFDSWEPFYEALERILPRFSKSPLLALIERQDGFIAPSES